MAETPSQKRFDSLLKKSIIIGPDRTEKEDPLLPIRQLKDVVIKTFNSDPTTAEYAINYIGSALCQLIKREFPKPIREFKNNPTLFVFNRPNWQAYIEQSFGQIRKKVINNAHGANHLLLVYKELLGCSTTKQRFNSILFEIKSLEEQLQFEKYESEERNNINQTISEIREIARKLKY